MKYKNCFCLSILYLIFLQLLNKLILNANCTLLTIISSYCFNAVLLLFVFLLVIKLLAIKYDIWLIDLPNKIVNRRTFNLILDRLRFSHQDFSFLSFKIFDIKSQKAILDSLKDHCYALHYHNNKIHVLVSNLFIIKNFKNIFDKCKIYHNKCKYLK